MRNPNGGRLVLLLSPVLCLLLPIAVVTWVLDRVSKNAVYDHLDRNGRSGTYQTTLTSDTGATSDISLYIRSGPTSAILGICIIGYAVVVLSAGGVWELRRVEGTASHGRAWGWTVFISNIIMIATSLGVFGYVSSVQANEKRWQSYEDISNADQEYTKETWACQVDQFYPNEDWAGTACRTAKAERFMLLALAISALLVLVSLWSLVRARGGVKWIFGGKGRYAAFQSMYEMQPPSTYVGEPPGGPQCMPQPVQQWSGQPVQQWAPQPYQQWVPHAVQHWAPPAVQTPKIDTTVEQRPVP